MIKNFRFKAMSIIFGQNKLEKFWVNLIINYFFIQTQGKHL